MTINIVKTPGNRQDTPRPINSKTPSNPKSTGRPQVTKPRSPAGNMQRDGDNRLTGNPSGSCSRRNKPTDDNTTDYQLVEQNTDQVNIVTLMGTKGNTRHVAGLIAGDGLITLKRFLMAGKKFLDAIKKARGEGKLFIKYSGILINIQTDPEQICVTDFTKQRFLAACHLSQHNASPTNDFSSPLVGRVSFTEGNQLNPIKALLGAGFQFLGSAVSDAVEAPEGIILFHLGCMVLDYIRRTSPTTSPSGMQNAQEINPEFVKFYEYAISERAGEGETFIAGCRNVNDSALSAIISNKKLFCEIASSAHVGTYGGNVKDRVAKNFKGMSTSLKQAIGRLRAEDAEN